MKRRVFAVAAVIGTMVLAACAPTPPTVTPPPVVPPTGDSPTGLDPSFGSDGYKNASMSTTGADRILAVAAGASNSVFGAGFVSDAGDTSFAVAKYTSNGVLDASFGTGGVSTVNVSPGTGTVEQARSITIQADGKIVIAGSVPTLAPGDDPRELASRPSDSMPTEARMPASAPVESPSPMVARDTCPCSPGHRASPPTTRTPRGDRASCRTAAS